MTLEKILQRFKNKENPKQIRRKSWTEETQPYEICYISSDCFYTSTDHEYHFPFDVEDIMANDWEYSDSVWVSK